MKVLAGIITASLVVSQASMLTGAVPSDADVPLSLSAAESRIP